MCCKERITVSGLQVMSHGSPEWCRLLFICLCCAVVESVSEDGQAELSVPCTGPPEP